METTEKIGRRKLKAQRLASAVSDTTRTLADIGRELYPNAENPSQTVSNCLKQPGPQAELRRIAKTFDPEQIRDEVMGTLDRAEVIAEGKQRADWMATTALGKAKVAGILIDKVQDVTDRANVRDMQREADKVLSSLAVSDKGIEPSYTE